MRTNRAILTLILVITLAGIAMLASVIVPRIMRRDTNSRIFASSGWQPTNIQIEQGQSFSIEVVDGQWQDADDIVVSTNGLDYVCGHQYCCEPMPYERRSALIGRIGTLGQPFLIGEGGRWTASSNGQLYLRINDCDSGLYDNKGWIQFDLIFPFDSDAD